MHVSYVRQSISRGLFCIVLLVAIIYILIKPILNEPLQTECLSALFLNIKFFPRVLSPQPASSSVLLLLLLSSNLRYCDQSLCDSARGPFLNLKRRTALQLAGEADQNPREEEEDI